MQKVRVVTECGEETTFCVEQDVETVTIDGEEWVKKTNEEEEKPQRITRFQSENGQYAIDAEWDVLGLYLEDDDDFNDINIRNSEHELLAAINKDNLKNVKF